MQGRCRIPAARLATLLGAAMPYPPVSASSWILSTFTFGALSSLSVTRFGKAITTASMMSWRAMKTIAPL